MSTFLRCAITTEVFAKNLLSGPYFRTFLMVYFKNTGDSIFYYRYLNLAKGLGYAIQPIFVEALSECEWSAEYVLYKSPPGPGGYNYAGTVHPEFFNRDYYSGLGLKEVNPWYGQDVVAAPATQEDGKHVMLSWTSQLHGGVNTGVYQIVMAVVEFNTLSDPADFYGGTSQGTTPGVSPTSMPLPKPNASSLPTLGSGSRARCLRDGLSLLTLRCKLGIATALSLWLATVA